MAFKPKRTKALDVTLVEKGVELDQRDNAIFWRFSDNPMQEKALSILQADLSASFQAKRNQTPRRLSQAQIDALRDASSRMLLGLAIETQLDPEQLVYRSSSKNKYDKSDGISFKVFEGCVHALCELGIIQRIPMDKPRLVEVGGETKAALGGASTRYSITDKFAPYLKTLGVDVSDKMHGDLAPDLIVLRRSKTKDQMGHNRAQGLDLVVRKSLKETQEYARLHREMQEINDFLSEQKYGGRLTTPPRLTRVFGGVEDQSYGFDFGGRLYAVEGSYQTWKKEAGLSASQIRVNNIRINDEPVVGLDVHASFPFLAEHLLSYTPDFTNRANYYHIEELANLVNAPHSQREAIAKKATKAVCLQVFGSGRAPARFDAKVKEQFPELSLSAPAVFKIVATNRETIAAFARPDCPHQWGDLHFLESEAFLSAIKELKQQGIPSLPVHDELIVPASKEREARDAILNGYRRFHWGGELPHIKATRTS